MLFRLLKNASKWVFKQIEEGGRRINEADERMIFGDKNDRNQG
jgi:hypothetical protein